MRICDVHLPAVNTPQFRWAKSLLDREAQPVPPIYQPEVAARGVVRVADHPRRELWIGASTTMTLLADRLASGLVERYLARRGVGAQLLDEPRDRTPRPHNLHAPVAGDVGAHGVFDRRARRHSPQLWLSEHRRAVGPRRCRRWR